MKPLEDLTGRGKHAGQLPVWSKPNDLSKAISTNIQHYNLTGSRQPDRFCLVRPIR